MAGLQPCLILLDLQMPTIDGWEFAARMARFGDAASSIPIVRLSGEPAAGRRPFGIRERLVKPVAYRTILAAVERHCAQAGDQAAAELHAATTPQEMG